jgi:ankyrin repeat protein
MIASKKGHTDIVRLLLNYGADPTLTAWTEDSVSFAVWRGHLEIVKLLYETGKLDLTV